MKHNWEYKKLEEVCNFVGGGTPSKSNDEFYTGSIPWATVRDMLTFKLYKTELCITEDAVNNSATNILPKGMIVISTHVGLGKICELMQDTAINQDLKGISFTDNSIDKYFFTYWYRSIANFIISKGRGATVKGVTLDFMRKLNIPVPPMVVQEQIVGELDKINELIDDCRELLRTLDNLAQSIFYDTFGDPISNPKGWEVKALKEAVIEMFLGPFGSALKTDCYVEENHAFAMVYEQKHAIKKTLELKNNFIDKDKFLSLKRFEVLPFDFIMSCRGTIGQLYQIPENSPRGIIHPSLMKIRLNKSTYIDSFFLYMLPIIIKEQQTKGNCVQMAITAKELCAKKLPVPPLTLQEEFAKRIEAIEAIKATTQQQLAAMQTLLDSRMDYWFN